MEIERAKRRRFGVLSLFPRRRSFAFAAVASMAVAFAVVGTVLFRPSSVNNTLPPGASVPSPDAGTAQPVTPGATSSARAVTQSAASPTLPPVVGPKDDALPLAGSDLTLALLIPPVMFADGECFVRDDLLAYTKPSAPTTVEGVQLLSLIDCNYQNGPLMRASYALAPDDAALAATFARWGLEDVPDGVDCRSHIPGRADYVDGGRTGTLKCWEEDNLATVRSIEFASSQRESRTLFAISARPSTSLHDLVTAWETGRP